MTDNEIKKALEDLFKLMLHDGDLQRTSIISKALDLIKRQKAEIESLKHRKTELQIRNQELQHEKSEAIKEFAERLKEKVSRGFWDELAYVDVDDIDNLVKEMTEVQE